MISRPFASYIAESMIFLLVFILGFIAGKVVMRKVLETSCKYETNHSGQQICIKSACK